MTRYAVAGLLGMVLVGCNSTESDDGTPETGGPAAPTVSLSASATTINSGETAGLSWSSTNATSCTASGGWSGSQPTSGSLQTAALASDTTFTLSCTGDGGTAEDSVTVSVTPLQTPAPVVTLTATPSSVQLNGSAVLSWSSTDATACNASGGWSGSKATTGSQTVGPLTATTSYSIECSGDGGMDGDTVTVTVSGGGGGSSAVSGFVDSSLIDVDGLARVYIYAGSVTPDDQDGDGGDPAFIADVKPVQNSCTFSYAMQSLQAGTYTLAFTSQAQADDPASDDVLDFRGTSVVTVDTSGTVKNFDAANILRVGAGRQYATIGAAADAAGNDTVIEIDAGDYPDDIVVWRQDRIVLRGVGGRAHVRGTQVIPFESGNDLRNGKGLWLVRGSDIKVENIEFSGARVTDENGAGIRNEGFNLSICNGYFHDNENGILGGAYGQFLIEYSEFDNNGYGDIGRTHNIYVDEGPSVGDKLVFRYNYSHRANIGHLLKTRARENYILYNRIMDENDGTSSYNIDVPNGGLTYVIGNLIQQGPDTDNSVIVAYGAEGLSGGRTHELYLVNNTIVNDRGSGTFMDVAGGTAVFAARNNLYVGGGGIYSGKTPDTDATNITTSSPGLVSRTGFDYRLTGTSPARDAGSAPGSAGGFSLVPAAHYVHPAAMEDRPADGDIDVGAYEYSP